MYWTPIFEHRERTNQKPPNQFPDPRDIIVDYATGSVSIYGALDAEAKQALDEIERVRDLDYEDIQALKADPLAAKEFKAFLSSVTRQARKLNSMLPPRLQRPVP